MWILNALAQVKSAVWLVIGFALAPRVGLAKLAFQSFRYHCCLKRVVRATRAPAINRDLASGRLAFIAPNVHPCLGESATTISRKIHNGEYSSVAVVSAFLQQARRVNKVLNAAVAWRDDLALKEAAEADMRIAAARAGTQTPLPPFLGVPCSVKEAIAVEGLQLTSGLASRRTIPPSTEDATVSERCVKEGC